MFDLREHLEERFGVKEFKKFDPEIILSMLFPKQLESINFKQRFRAVYCTRRAGKSVSRLAKALYLNTKFPGSRCVYGALTQSSAVNIGWDLFLEFCNDFEIRVKTNHKDMKIVLPDFGGSSMQFFGLDASEKAARRILGQNLRYFVADEAGSITQNLQRICFQFIRPALIDLSPNSYLDLCGTPENIPNTYFSKVCLGEDKSFNWAIYNWTAFDNPHISKQWEQELSEIPEEFKLTHEYKCHYLGQFSVNTDALMLTITEKNYVDTSTMDLTGYTAVMGVDLGYNDSTAITVGLFNAEKNNKLIIPFAQKEKGLDIEEALFWVQDVQKEYNAFKVVIDGANKQGVEYMRKRFPVPMEAADKKDKGTFLRALQADLTMMRILIDPRACMPLLEECESAIWDEERRLKGHLIEDSRCLRGDVLVLTIFGWKRIDEIDKGDWIVTEYGPRPVLKNICRHEIPERVSSISTYDHKWIIGGKECQEFMMTESKLSMMESYFVDILALAGQKIGCTTFVAKKGWKGLGCTNISGKSITGKGLRAIMSIILMAIKRITIYLILNFCLLENILSFIIEKIQNSIIIGKKQRLEKQECEITTNQHLEDFIVSKRKNHALFARKPFLSQKQLEETKNLQNVVPVGVIKFFIVKKIWLRLAAQVVRWCLKDQNIILKEKPSVQKSVKKDTIKVYDLCILGRHEFVTNYGLSHNCVVDQIDSFLYLHRHSFHYNYKEKAPEIKKDSTEYWDKYWDDKVTENENADDMESILMGRGNGNIGYF